MVTVADLCSSTIHTPNYQSDQLSYGIVHLGFGAFHRAHQSMYTHQILQQGDYRWGEAVVNLRSGDELIKQLNSQKGRYSVCENDGKQQTITICGDVIRGYHPKLDGPAAIIDLMSHDSVKIISLTITEKGYYWDSRAKQLLWDHPDIKHDLATPQHPKTALGYLAATLTKRYHEQKPITILSCDNFMHNGHIIRQALLAFIDAYNSQLADWVEQTCRFPCCMVDRIVPAMSDESHQQLQTLLGGVNDPCGIMCEPFSQWVIEDDFAVERPAWENVGAQLVSDVTPFEQMKLRLLNGTHSFLAYLGYLGGYQTIAETISQTTYQQAAWQLMLSIQAPTLHMPKEVDVQAYAQSLLKRFSNPSLQHRTYQVAMDGSQKLPQRLGDAINYYLAQNDRLPNLLALTIAGWLRYSEGVDEQGRAFELQDPLADKISQYHHNIANRQDRVKPLLSLVFPHAISEHPQVQAQVTSYYQQLGTQGAEKCIQACLDSQTA
ncbi:mannitol dehydrogenase family protein [Celerinatantimonas yamalensis]|uniref:Mannitol dehydrogenase family protein n=1 Tax=Celerinatantimonas yamalensis TaxID=559956 RepID=A0ABW9G9R0_9GAMM